MLSTETVQKIYLFFPMFSSESKGDRGDERGAGMRMNPHTGLPFSPRYFELFR